VHQFEIKGLNIIDAQCNHEVYVSNFLIAVFFFIVRW